MFGSPASSLYAFTPFAGSMPVSRFTRAILRPRTPPRALSSWTAALSELVVTVPMKAPMPEKGAMTPTFKVSPVAPAIFLEPPPEPHAASTAPERLTAAAEPMPALPAHSMNVRLEMSLLTCRSMKSRPCSGFISPGPFPTAGCCVIKV